MNAIIKKDEPIVINKIPCKYYNRFFITMDLNEFYKETEILEKYNQLYILLKNKNISPLNEKIFGITSLKNPMAELRKNQIKTSFPSSFINYETITGAPISSVFLYGVEILDKDKCSIKTIAPNTLEFSTYDATHLFVNGVQELNGAKGGNDFCSSERLFDAVEKCLKNANYEPTEIVRTWFYIDDIVGNYESFNAARRVFFDRNGINYNDNALRLPSSTGIGALPERGIHMDMYCIRQNCNMPHIKRVYNQKQNEANGSSYLFKSTFSRGMEIVTKDYLELHISGTASINREGKSVHINDSYQQIATTLENIYSILKQYNMNFNDFTHSTCFFKRKEYYQDFLKVMTDMNLDKFCSTFVVGDVCRDELLFEMDGIAIKSTAKDSIL